MKTLSAKDKMLKTLKANRNRDAFTTRQAKRRFGISGIRQRIHELRQDGFNIVTCSKYVNGRRVTAYRLAA